VILPYQAPGPFSGVQSVRQRDTFVPPADVSKPAEPLPFARSLFDSVVSTLPTCGMKIALNPSGKFRLPHLKKRPSGRLP
jgi:hypothetical protein